MSRDVASLLVDWSGPADGAGSDELARRLYAECGCFVARGVVRAAALDRIRASIRRLIQLRREHFLGDSDPAVDGPFDSAFLDLVRRDPDSRDVVMAALSRTFAVQELGLDAGLERLSRVLMGADFLQASALNAMQVHLPNEAGRLLPWHQDYPHVQDSEDGVVYWIPLSDLDAASVALEVALGSHTLGVVPLWGDGPDGPPRGHVLPLDEPTLRERFPRRVMPVRPGDALAFSTRLLHASVPNDGARTRWTLQVRHGNFAHPRAVARGWPGTCPGRLPFARSHPEYYVDQGGNPAERGLSQTR